MATAHGTHLRLLAAVGAAGVACGPIDSEPLHTPPDHPPGDVAEIKAPVYYLASTLWTTHNIPVCWNTAGYVTEKRWVQQSLKGQRSWEMGGNINLVGWGDCNGATGGIQISVTGRMATLGLGQSGGLTRMEMDFSASPQTKYDRCTLNGLSREQCIKTAALHEFGHAFGIDHEQNRSDREPGCRSDGSGLYGDTTFGYFDPQSIMLYSCGAPKDLSGLDRRGFERMYGLRSGNESRLLDFNGDRRADLMCHDPVTGERWTSLANTSGQYTSNDWYTWTAFCGVNGKLYRGDFNGDGRADLLCHELTTGTKRITFADTAGRFGGSPVAMNNSWCNGDSQTLHLGDFNGDGREDLLCHDVTSGNKWIDYADTAGIFGGTDWNLTNGWCNHGTGRLFVGDFNGDNRDDMLCRDQVTAHVSIDYADTNGRFAATDWSLETQWCTEASGRFMLGDFNGDGRQDWLCHDEVLGYKRFDYADTAGAFSGTDWHIESNWCGDPTSRLHIGDVNADGRDDLLCHDARTGHKAVDYSDASARFYGSDWGGFDIWCSHDSAQLH